MRRLSRYILVLGIASAAPFAATGQPVPPGEEGELASFLPPEEGARICYRRAYSPEHLAKHPDQTVTEVEFRLAYYRHDADEFYPQGQRNYYFAMLAKRRGGDRTLTASAGTIRFADDFTGTGAVTVAATAIETDGTYTAGAITFIPG